MPSGKALWVNKWLICFWQEFVNRLWKGIKGISDEEIRIAVNDAAYIRDDSGYTMAYKG